MTHDPRLPTIEEMMNGLNRDPRELIDTPLGKMERWCAETMLIGQTKGALSVFDAIRADAATEAARADAEQARTALIKNVCARVNALTARVDAVTSELETIKAKERADAKAAADAEEERLRELAEDPLEDPPDIAEYQARNLPSKIGDDTHQPGGELHTVGPSKDPEPDLEVEDDELGDLPEELRDLPDPAPPPRGSVQPQPVSISLNKE